MSEKDTDDEYCQKLYEEYLNDPDKDKDEEFCLEDCKKNWGIS